MHDTENDHPILPPEAGDSSAEPFDPNDDWLRAAEPELQKEAMRQWFYARYQDPVHDTPRADGEYIFVGGGPYDPSDELQGRFTNVVPFDTIWEVVEELYAECGDEWAPIDRDYETAFEFEANTRDDPRGFLLARFEQIDFVLATVSDERIRPFVLQLLYSSLIAALEAYLADTLSFWIAVDRGVLQDFVAGNKDFQERKFTLAEIFERMNHLDSDVERYLQELVWHRLDKIKPLLEAGLRITVPPIDLLMTAIIVRHDIVHRGGKTKSGAAVHITEEMVRTLRENAMTFASQIDAAIEKRFPRGQQVTDDTLEF